VNVPDHAKEVQALKNALEEHKAKLGKLEENEETLLNLLHTLLQPKDPPKRPIGFV
jgi:hypothetical protein